MRGHDPIGDANTPEALLFFLFLFLFLLLASGTFRTRREHLNRRRLPLPLPLTRLKPLLLLIIQNTRVKLTRMLDITFAPRLPRMVDGPRPLSLCLTTNERANDDERAHEQGERDERTYVFHEPLVYFLASAAPCGG